MVQIAILDDYQRVALTMADWQSLPAEITVFDEPLGDENALVERLKKFSIICAMRERTLLPRTLLERLPELKLLVTSGMKNAAIDVQAAQELGIVVCGTPAPGHATAELTWGLILALLRHIPQEDRAMREGRWQTTLGRDLNGKTLGVLGLGRLGSKVATVGRAFGMAVLAWSENLTPERAAEVGVERAASKAELLQRADILTIHLRLSARTRGLIGEREFSLMKTSAYLINTSRGPIVDEQALVQALEQSRIAGAGIDVYDTEPLPAGHRLRQLENTVITPHLGYVTVETYREFYQGMVTAIAAFLQGNPVSVLRP